MVGPSATERYVLRDTDGERFVPKHKEAFFQENSQPEKERKRCEVICLMIENLLYVTLYPHTIELFAFQKSGLLVQRHNEFFS